MRRREFFARSTALAAAPMLPRRVRSAEAASDKPSGRAMTVTGPVPAAELGFTLPHEHVMVDFIGAEQVSRDRYDRDRVLEVVLPHLQRARGVGCRAIAECTPQYLARDPVLLRRLSRAADLHLLTNTGYYGARDDQHLPPHAFDESADRLADRWAGEYENGIGETGIRPGFIKIGVDRGSLSDVDEKLVRAAARAHLRTGLTIASHTGPAKPAFEQLDVIEEEGVDPAAFIWVHAQAERDMKRHVEAAKRGAWVEFDGVRPEGGSIDRHVKLARNMKEHGLLGRALVSQDAGWYTVGEPNGGDFRGYDTLARRFIPKLRPAGFDEARIHQLITRNPARALALRKRPRR